MARDDKRGERGELLRDLGGLARGMGTTLRNFVRKPETISYPEEHKEVSARFHGRHLLLRHEDELERCIGCELCAAACPSEAIYVEAAENDPDNPVSHGQRYAARYEINMIRCIFCGYCEEACPVEAVVLGPWYELADSDRGDFIYTKDMLLLDPGEPDPRRQAESAQG
jgi:NADH-quinone oxidoreductase subunit I